MLFVAMSTIALLLGAMSEGRTSGLVDLAFLWVMPGDPPLKTRREGFEDMDPTETSSHASVFSGDSGRDFSAGELVRPCSLADLVRSAEARKALRLDWRREAVDD